MLDRLLDGPDRRLLDRAWIVVVAIEVLTKRVEPVVAAIDTIWIEHWYDLENELVPQHFGLNTFLIG